MLDLVRQLSVDERRKLLDTLLAERFDSVLGEADRRRGGIPEVTDDQIQEEIDAVRRKRRQGLGHAAGG